MDRHPGAELIAARLTNRRLFDDLNAEREYDALIAAHHAALSPEAKQEIAGFIDAGPTCGRDDDDYVDRWRLQMLERLPELPDEWQQRLDELRGRYGQAEPPRLPEVRECAQSRFVKRHSRAESRHPSGSHRRRRVVDRHGKRASAAESPSHSCLNLEGAQDAAPSSQAQPGAADAAIRAGVVAGGAFVDPGVLLYSVMH